MPLIHAVIFVRPISNRSCYRLVRRILNPSYNSVREKLDSGLTQGKLPGNVGIAAAYGDHGLVQAFGQRYVVVGADLDVAPGEHFDWR